MNSNDDFKNEEIEVLNQNDIDNEKLKRIVKNIIT